MAESDVAVVFPAAGPTGGVERVAAELLRDQSRRRPTAFVGTTLAPGVADEEHPVRHVAVRPRRAPASLRPAAFRAAALRALAEGQPATTISFGVECPPGDVLWVHSVHAAWLARGSAVRVRGRTVPPAARRLLPRHRVLLALEARYFAGGAPRLVLCTSQQEVDDLAHHYDVPPALTRVVPNGFDAAVFDVGRREALRATARAAIGARTDDVVVLMVANEWHRKGLGPLLDAVAALGDPRVRVDLVGRQGPGEYATQAARLGLGDRLHWHGPATDVTPSYAAADVFALPTTYEPFGIVVVEAMAMGLPVVVPRLAGAAAAVDPGVSGLLLDNPRDVDELTGALRRLGEPDERARIGAAAPGAVAHLGWGQVLARADDLVFGSRPGG